MAFTPLSIGSKDCTTQNAGSPDTQYHYILKATTGDTQYPADACSLLYHSWFQVDRVQLNQQMTGLGLINITGPITSATTVVATTSMTAPIFNGSATTAKAIGGAFDVPHWKDEKKRVRHVIAEGPEAGIYIRGTMKDTNIINLPEYGEGLVDPETITVTLTQIGTSQDLIVDGIEWGRRIKVKSGNASTIHCYYEVWAARWINPCDHDEKLHVVYEGDSPDDYPGNNEFFLIGGWDYDRRETKWRKNET
jgi:hypothetical protein